MPLVDECEDDAGSDEVEVEAEGAAEHGLRARWPREGLAGAKMLFANALREVHVRAVVPRLRFPLLNSFRYRMKKIAELLIGISIWTQAIMEGTLFMGI